MYRSSYYWSFRTSSFKQVSCLILTGSSSRLLRIRFSANLTMYWFPVHEIEAISDMDLESKYCYFYHSWDFVPYQRLQCICKRQISIKLFYLYQRLQCRDKYFFKIKFVFFLYLRLSASSKENDLPLCIYFWYQTDSGVPI